MYKDQYSYEKRLEESTKIMKKYPGRIPVIVEIDPRQISTLPPLDKRKYLVPSEDVTVGQFLSIIRKRIKIESDEALFLFINNTIPATASLMSHVYNENKSDCGFLFCIIATESTFGV